MRYLIRFFKLCRRYNVRWAPETLWSSRVSYKQILSCWSEKNHYEVKLYCPLPITKKHYAVFLHELGHWVFDKPQMEQYDFASFSKVLNKNWMNSEIRAWKFACRVNDIVDEETMFDLKRFALGTHVTHTNCSMAIIQRYNMYIDYLYGKDG